MAVQLSPFQVLATPGTVLSTLRAFYSPPAPRAFLWDTEGDCSRLAKSETEAQTEQAI